jgi:hypothetical protein
LRATAAAAVEEYPMSSEQRLNTVDRFRKHPGRLVLEEYSSCEIPAGCGGVVLRWRNPLAAAPFTVYLHPAASCFIDGKALQSSRVDLAPGPHALALVFNDVELSTVILLAAVVFDPPSSPRRRPGELVESPLKVLSAADGTWKCSLDLSADEAWKTPDFDDAAWPALILATDAGRVEQATDTWQGRRCADQGAVGLSLPADRARPAKGVLCVRKSFVVPAPQPSPAAS